MAGIDAIFAHEYRHKPGEHVDLVLGERAVCSFAGLYAYGIVVGAAVVALRVAAVPGRVVVGNALPYGVAVVHEVVGARPAVRLEVLRVRVRDALVMMLMPISAMYSQLPCFCV